MSSFDPRDEPLSHLIRERAAAYNTRNLAPQYAAQCECRQQLERYRHALAQIARHSDCEYARRLADDALSETKP